MIGFFLLKNNYFGTKDIEQKIPEVEILNLMTLYFDSNDVYNFYSDAFSNAINEEIDSEEIDEMLDFYIFL